MKGGCYRKSALIADVPSVDGWFKPIPEMLIQHLRTVINEGRYMFPKSSGEHSPGHLEYMLDKIEGNTMSGGKNNRWIGYIQGVVTMVGASSVADERVITASAFNQ